LILLAVAAAAPQVFGDRLGVAPVVSALLAVCLLLLLGVLEWSDCLSYGAAWDTFLWFSGEWVCVWGGVGEERAPAPAVVVW
jgi:DASS family divalent anion:Na+ symporter